MNIKLLFVIVGAVLLIAVVAAGVIFALRQHSIAGFKAAAGSLPEKFVITAHTGCVDTEENSLESIDAAFDAGADIVEFDLNFTENGEPVLAHDTPKGGELSLDEAFKKVSEYDGIMVNVDIKNVTALEKVKPLAEKYGIAERIFFTGVKDEFLEAVKSNGMGVPYYLNVDVEPKVKHTEEYLALLVQKVKDSGAIGINFNKKNASAELVEAFHANGLLVSIWTVNSEYDMYRMLSYAPDNITTRRPDLIRKIFES